MNVALYSNENIPLRLVLALRQLGYEVLTSFDAGQANRGLPDEDVLAFATGQRRAVLTFNRRDFQKLHRITGGKHEGIICCTVDADHAALAARIDERIRAAGASLAGQEVRVVRGIQAI